MAFDGITVAALADELNTRLSGGRIAKIAQPEADELLLSIKTAREQEKLYLSASPSLPLAYLTDENKPGPMTAPNFCMVLRKHVAGGRILSVTQPGLERILNIRIEHRNELGDLCEKTLIVELMGKHSNLIFTDDTGKIIDSIKHVSAQMSSVREVLPGRAYFIPDTQHKLDPLTVTEDAFSSVLREKPMAVGKALYLSLTGISPVVAEEICYISGVDSGTPAGELSPDVLTHLYRQFSYYMDQVRQKQFEPAIYYDGQTPVEFGVLPLTQFAGCRREIFSSVSEMLAAYYRTRNTLTRMRQKSADLRHTVQTALERNQKKYDLQEKQLHDTENREQNRIYGELINTYGYNLAPRAKSLTCENYYTGRQVTIPLDPQLTPQENAQRYFARYNKQKRTFEALQGRTHETAGEVEYLESVLNSLDMARSEADLSQIKEELTQSGYLRRRTGKAARSGKNNQKNAKNDNRPLHYISSDGYDMYVGKNNLQNDELTFSFADGGDWWFHAKKCPGSHVIVKCGGEMPPDSTFEEAGRLAAYYSKNRNSSKIEVDYVQKKYVKKPNGAKPGFVVYYTNYSLMIDSDISQIRSAD